MMTRKILSTLILGSFTAIVSASPVTPAEAISRLAASSPQQIKGKVSATSPAMTVYAPAGQPGVYIFNGDGIFYITAADDCGAPLLGYGPGNIDPDNLPPAMAGWLDGQARIITEASAAGAAAYSRSESDTPDGRHAIEPMLPTEWDQLYPYNNKCPVFRGTERCATGCTTTALAQIMRYWQWPSQGTGSFTYTDVILGDTVTLSANFGETVYEWDKMPLLPQTPYTTAQVQSVSTLMADLGIAMMSDYASSDQNATAAFTSNAINGAVKYFSYAPNATYIERAWVTPELWEETVYATLEAGYPVMYSGYNASNSGGHAFVCDGYDGSSRFHFNWGWSGYGDGWYLLESLNPGGGGVGGGTYDFSYFQHAAFGVQPDFAGDAEPVPNFFIYGDINCATSLQKYPATIRSTIVNHDYYGFYNYSLTGEDPEINFGLEFVNDSTGERFSMPSSTEAKFGFLSGTTAYSVTVKDGDIPVGDYSVLPVVRIAGSDNWYPMRIAHGRDATYTAHVGKHYLNIHNSTTNKAVLEVTAAEIPDATRADEPFDVTLEIRSLHHFYDGSINVMYVRPNGRYTVLGTAHASIDEDATATVTVACTHTLADGDYELVIGNADRSVIADSYTLHVGEAALDNISSDELEVIYSPAERTVTVTGADNALVTVYSTNGAELLSANGPRISVAALVPGVYIIRCQGRAQRVSIR